MEVSTLIDDALGKLLREARPPIRDDAPRRDVWPSLVERLDERTRWSLTDVGLGIAAVVALLMFPGWLWLLYHL